MNPVFYIFVGLVMAHFILVVGSHFRIITKKNNKLYRFTRSEAWLFPKLGLRWLPDASWRSLRREDFETEEPYEFSDTAGEENDPIAVRIEYTKRLLCERGLIYRREDLKRALGEKIVEYLMDRVVELELAEMPTMSEPWQEDMRRAINYIIEMADTVFKASISSLTITIKEGVVQVDINSGREAAVSFSPTPNEG